MEFPRRPLLVLTTRVALMNPAMAGDWTVGLETLFDRAPDDFNEPIATKFYTYAARTFTSGVVLGGSFEPQIKAQSSRRELQPRVYIGLRVEAEPFRVTGRRGWRGRRFQEESSGGNFPYYVLRVQADIDLSERWSWNVVTYRFRNAFDTENDYNTPEVSSAIALKIDGRSSVYAKYYYAWKDGNPDNQGIGLGFKHRF